MVILIEKDALANKSPNGSLNTERTRAGIAGGRNNEVLPIAWQIVVPDMTAIALNNTAATRLFIAEEENDISVTQKWTRSQEFGVSTKRSPNRETKRGNRRRTEGIARFKAVFWAPLYP